MNTSNRISFQCFTCQAVTKFGGFNEHDRYECYYCFKDRQRTAKPAAGRRKAPALYMDRKSMTDEIVMSALKQRLSVKK